MMTNLTKQEINKIYNALITDILKPIFKEHSELSKEYFYNDGKFKPPIYKFIDEDINLAAIAITPLFISTYPEVYVIIEPHINEAQELINSIV